MVFYTWSLLRSGDVAPQESRCAQAGTYGWELEPRIRDMPRDVSLKGVVWICPIVLGLYGLRDVIGC